MVPKQVILKLLVIVSFRAVLFRMVPKHKKDDKNQNWCFRAVLFRMVPKRMITS